MNKISEGGKEAFLTPDTSLPASVSKNFNSKAFKHKLLPLFSANSLFLQSYQKQTLPPSPPALPISLLIEAIDEVGRWRWLQLQQDIHGGAKNRSVLIFQISLSSTSCIFFLLVFAEEGQDSAKKKKHFPKAKLEADWKDPVSAS